MNDVFLGIDVGSVTVKTVLCTGVGELVHRSYERIHGDPVTLALDQAKDVSADFGDRFTLGGVGVTGSGRSVAGKLLDVSVTVNEITANAAASLFCCPDVRTVIEIGGQDSKIILIRDDGVVDFSLNTLCAAGTGSFLDHQASRIGIPVDRFGEYYSGRTEDLPLSAGCAVFAETDMIRYQQAGQPSENIIAGLLRALARNYLNNVGRGKEIERPVLFQGGVARNRGMVESLGEELGFPVIVPRDPHLMGAYGCALLAMEGAKEGGGGSSWENFPDSVERRTKTCRECPMDCLLMEFRRSDGTVVIAGDRCNRWTEIP